jgi:hypothetical protein
MYIIYYILYNFRMFGRYLFLWNQVQEEFEDKKKGSE